MSSRSFSLALLMSQNSYRHRVINNNIIIIIIKIIIIPFPPGRDEPFYLQDLRRVELAVNHWQVIVAQRCSGGDACMSES
jgi:hypothetical protein